MAKLGIFSVASAVAVLLVFVLLFGCAQPQPASTPNPSLSPSIAVMIMASATPTPIKLKLPVKGMTLIPRPRSVIKTFTVDAKENVIHSWGGGVDTGIDLRDGDTMEFNATGEWYIGENPHARIPNDGFVNMGFVGPDGSPDYTVNPAMSMATGEITNIRYGALTGSMGAGTNFFLIGSHRTKTRHLGSSEAKRLYLYCWDDGPSDNHGTVTVTVKVTPR